MKIVQRILAVALVATVLCADQALASPAPQQPVPSTAQQTLVGRLTVNLRRCVPATRILETRRDLDRPALTIVQLPIAQPVSPATVSPFQFRLPPPLA